MAKSPGRASRAVAVRPRAESAAPGSFLPLRDRWGHFDTLASTLPPGAIALVDRRVARAHPHVTLALRRTEPALLRTLLGGERIKTLATAERILAAAVKVRRGTTVIAVGGGTLGDLAAVVAHLHKRGARLVQVPTTVLAAVDSSVGGKGAVDLAGTKNAVGVFHYPVEGWICPELFTSLSPAQVREGTIEAWKMAVCLSPGLWRQWTRTAPDLHALIRASRRMKAQVCRVDPYERLGQRRVLNFGHTFGHVLESLSGFRIRHGDAVGIGMLCALDLGRAVGVTPDGVASEVEDALCAGPLALGRPALARVLSRSTPARIEAILRADKKRQSDASVTMVLLERIGVTQIQEIEPSLWRKLLPAWRDGVRP
ncbi:MAG: 3-dehydroquinate synthase [Myxococcaceae bacterium]|nr:3-dehydroquinate synthase [Myxococcaceae bacterium]